MFEGYTFAKYEEAAETLARLSDLARKLLQAKHGLEDPPWPEEEALRSWAERAAYALSGMDYREVPASRDTGFPEAFFQPGSPAFRYRAEREEEELYLKTLFEAKMTPSNEDHVALLVRAEVEVRRP